jgi:hypothetical protein
MRKPLHGDQLTIRYEGALVRARCDDVTEAPNRGVGAAQFTIVSPARFERGHPAQLIQGANELPVEVLRVTAIGHHRVSKINVVLFSGIFDSAIKADAPSAEIKAA